MVDRFSDNQEKRVKCQRLFPVFSVPMMTCRVGTEGSLGSGQNTARREPGMQILSRYSMKNLYPCLEVKRWKDNFYMEIKKQLQCQGNCRHLSGLIYSFKHTNIFYIQRASPLS